MQCNPTLPGALGYTAGAYVGNGAFTKVGRGVAVALEMAIAVGVSRGIAVAVGRVGGFCAGAQAEADASHSTKATVKKSGVTF